MRMVTVARTVLIALGAAHDFKHAPVKEIIDAGITGQGNRHCTRRAHTAKLRADVGNLSAHAPQVSVLPVCATSVRS